MWSTGYRDIPYWEDMSMPTYLAPIGLSLYLALASTRRHERWLGPVVVWVVICLYVAACFAFLTTPIGEVSHTQKYGHNVALLVIAVLLSLVAAGRAAGPRRPDPAPDRGAPTR